MKYIIPIPTVGSVQNHRVVIANDINKAAGLLYHGFICAIDGSGKVDAHAIEITVAEALEKFSWVESELLTQLS